MKKIVPFKKDIDFDTNIAAINSIALDHSLNQKEDNVIVGNFTVSGTYKMTPASTTLDNFEFALPVNITIDKKYNIDNISIDINDFYYELINNKTLSINIEVVVDNLEEIKEEVTEEVREETEEEIKEEPLEERNEVTSIFSNLNDNEEYVTYKIHIVTEGDTIESIMEAYNVTKDILEDYNDLENIKIGDKIIIANESK